jgi:UDP-2,4-diacetamido-2,4,6-trideoxy-beta-L-altropyranose hydrolase
LLIAEDGRGPIGVLRYDFKESVATVSIYLVPERHGQGAGSVLLRLGEEWLARHRPDARRIEADVLAANSPSMVAFAEAGYTTVKHTLSKQLG